MKEDLKFVITIGDKKSRIKITGAKKDVKAVKEKIGKGNKKSTAYLAHLALTVYCLYLESDFQSEYDYVKNEEGTIVSFVISEEESFDYLLENI